MTRTEVATGIAQWVIALVILLLIAGVWALTWSPV